MSVNLEIRTHHASSVIVHHVRTAASEEFLTWQHGVTAAAAAFAGYQSTDVYPPAPGKPGPWVIVVHFDKPAALAAWLASTARAAWTARLPQEARDFELRTLSEGFGAWFAGSLEAERGLPPEWKMAMAVLLGLYPTVMVLNWLTSPYNERYGLPNMLLVSCAMSTCLLQWLVMPAVTRILRPWMRLSTREHPGASLGGAVAMIAALIALAYLL